MRHPNPSLAAALLLPAAIFLYGCSGSGPATPAAAAPAGSRPNLVIITVDTLRADHLGAWGSTSTATPNIDALAARSVRFERAYAAFPKTNPSLSSLMTGRYASAHGVRRNGAHLPESERTLAEVLKDAGYGTYAFICNHVMVSRYGLAQGFTLYDQNLPDAIVTRKAHERIAEHLVGAVLDWADAAKPVSPFFLWAHFIDPHGPYTPPGFVWKGGATGATLPVSTSNGGLKAIPAYQALPGITAVDEYVARYSAEIDYLDRQVGRLLEGLRSRGMLDNALLVFGADHGESLGGHDLYFQHGSSLYEAQIHVPLLFAGPGIRAATIETPVSTVDVMPTVLDRLGIPAPAKVQGASLNAWLDGKEPVGAGERMLFAELGKQRAAMRGPLKLIWDGDRKSVDLFDEDADPLEEHDIASTRPEEGRRMLEAIVRFSRENTRDEAADEDEETRKILKSLGYVD